jgi:hypothetical protein
MKSAISKARDGDEGECLNGTNPAEEDPYLLYGFGIYAYFDLLKLLIYLFTALSLIFLPSILFNVKYDGILDAEDYAAASLGNQGYTEPMCYSTPMSTSITESEISC